MSGKKSPRKPRKPRLKWDRNPVQRPHSSKKGKKGYDRGQEKERFRKEIEETEQD